MFMKRTNRKWTKEEKEKIILDVQRMGVIAGCRKHSIEPNVYYYWLKKYEVHGIEGLEGRQNRDLELAVKKLEKENRALKEILAEKELQSRMKDELLKKKFAQWDKKKK